MSLRDAFMNRQSASKWLPRQAGPQAGPQELSQGSPSTAEARPEGTTQRTGEFTRPATRHWIMHHLLAWLVVFWVTASAAAQPEKRATAAKPLPLHVESNRLKSPQGTVVRPQGVNIASLEWTSRGENVLRSVTVAIDDWGCNLIRLPLAQDRWFGRAREQRDGGVAYRQLIQQAVQSAAERRCYVVLDLHWSNAGVWGQNTGQHWMPDDHSATFWQAG